MKGENLVSFSAGIFLGLESISYYEFPLNVLGFILSFLLCVSGIRELFD